MSCEPDQFTYLRLSPQQESASAPQCSRLNTLARTLDESPFAVRLSSAFVLQSARLRRMESESDRSSKIGLSLLDSAKYQKGLEARAGIEPAHKGFADLSLTTWVPRLGRAALFFRFAPYRRSQPGWRRRAEWSGRRDLNSRPSPWQGDALPLSYSRLLQN